MKVPNLYTVNYAMAGACFILFILNLFTGRPIGAVIQLLCLCLNLYVARLTDPNNRPWKK